MIDHQNVLDFSQRMHFKSGNFDAVRDYYYWAASTLNYTKFKTKIDRIIWEHHAEGESSRRIEIAVGRDQTWICRRIIKIREYLVLDHYKKLEKKTARMMHDQDEVVLRHFKSEDMNCLSSNWGNSYWQGSNSSKVFNPEEFHSFHRLVRDRFFKKDNAQVIVCASSSDPWLILGWIAMESVNGIPIIQYVYVKEAFRGKGIARLLVERSITTRPVVFTHMTDKAREIIASNKSYFKEFIHIPNLV